MGYPPFLGNLHMIHFTFLAKLHVLRFEKCGPGHVQYMFSFSRIYIYMHACIHIHVYTYICMHIGMYIYRYIIYCIQKKEKCLEFIRGLSNYANHYFCSKLLFLRRLAVLSFRSNNSQTPKAYIHKTLRS